MEDTQRTKSEHALREEKVLEMWRDKNIFSKTLKKPSPKGEFIFYEGPPTANAAPALHHLEARAFKDIIPRYKTMQGFHVRRKGGWDTHGLPVELQIEKKLGLNNKKAIEQYGIAQFNKECKESVFTQIDAWAQFTDRIGYWVDQKDAYVTYHNSYMESLWNIVAQVEKKGLLYKDYRVVPWCTRCGTALSSHELAQGYQDVTDLSLYTKFKLEPGQEYVGGITTNTPTYILAWTTTPWTLPGNVGLAVGEDIEYLLWNILDQDSGISENIIIAKDRTNSVLDVDLVDQNNNLRDLLSDKDKKNTKYSLLGKIKGSDLIGLSYEPLYPFLRDILMDQGVDVEKAFKIYPASFVTTTDGTGVVHTAVMYGQDDFELGTKVGLPKYHLVSEDGLFIPGTDFLAGRYVKDEAVTVDIIKDLAGRKLLFKKEKYTHSYPHCWRCKTALIYYARDSWYIRMSSLREELQKENEKIHWEPDHYKHGRFGEWLKEAKDWAISRERYWGTPLPVWTTPSGKRFVISSIEELKSYIPKRNTYTLIRHGESAGNIEQDLISSKNTEDNPLTANGKEEVKASIQQLKVQGVDLIIASPFLRTKQTAEIIAEELGLPKESIKYDDRLREIGGGSYDGKPWEEFLKNFTSIEDRFTKRVGDAESWGDVRRRVMECMYDIDARYEGKRILVVGHGGPLNMIVLASKGHDQRDMIRHYYDDSIMNAEIVPCDFRALPHNDVFDLDLHRPYIDTCTCISPEGEVMTRVKEVMDVWFDSGAMPFAQDHYPFENKEWVEGTGYPADFISEAIDQTRGWFYTLLSVGVLTGRGTPYKNVVSLGHLLDKDGKKMSKSIGNVVNPWDMMDVYGVDALRLWMYSVNQPGDSKNFDEKTVDEVVKKVINPLLNIYTLFDTYRVKGESLIYAHTSDNPLDQWIVARFSELVTRGTVYLDNYKIFEPVRLLKDFVSDFSTWYIRRSRERFKSKDDTERIKALSVTAYVLDGLAKYMAPMAPFFADWLYLSVYGTQESVHLEEWPQIHTFDEQIIKEMEKVRDMVSELLEYRQKANIKVRQPLAKVTVREEIPLQYKDIILDELNIKEIIVDSRQESSYVLDTHLTQDLIEEGMVRDLIRAIQDARKKEGLTPSQTIKLSLSTTQKDITYRFEQMIKEPTGITNIVYTQDSHAYTIAFGEGQLSFSLVY